MSQAPGLTNEEKDKWFIVDYLGLKEDSSPEEVMKTMRFFLDAQDDINRATYEKAALPTDEWSAKLLEISKGADATIFWHLFYDYDTRHHEGRLREEGLSRVRVVGGF